MIRTVADLKRALEAFPDDMPAAFTVQTPTDTEWLYLEDVSLSDNGSIFLLFDDEIDGMRRKLTRWKAKR